MFNRSMFQSRCLTIASRTDVNILAPPEAPRTSSTSPVWGERIIVGVEEDMGRLKGRI